MPYCSSFTSIHTTTALSPSAVSCSLSWHPETAVRKQERAATALSVYDMFLPSVRFRMAYISCQAARCFLARTLWRLPLYLMQIWDNLSAHGMACWVLNRLFIHVVNNRFDFAVKTLLTHLQPAHLAFLIIMRELGFEAKCSSGC